MDKDGNFIADCNDDDLYSKAESCEVQMKYCFGARHADEDNAAAAQCLRLKEAHANMNGNEMASFNATLCEDTKMREDGTYDCKICKNRSNPAEHCETMDVNICECVESKTIMDFVAMQDDAECPADDELVVDICGECDLDIKINCMARANPWSDTWVPGGCSADNGFSIVGVDGCMEDIKFCYEVHNTGDSCAYWNDLDMGASRTVTNGDMVQLTDLIVTTTSREDGMICPGDDPIVICEKDHIPVDSCKCMTVIAEARAKNPRGVVCSTQANYGFCKEEESRSEDVLTDAPSPAPTASEGFEAKGSFDPESESKDESTPKPTKQPTQEVVSVESKKSHTTPAPKPTKAPSKPSPSTVSSASAQKTPSPHTPPSEPSMKSESSKSASETTPLSLPSSGSSTSEDHSGTESSSQSLPSGGSAQSPPTKSSSQSLPSGGSAKSSSSSGTAPLPSLSTSSSGTAPSSSGDSGSSGASGGSSKGKGKGGSSGTAPSSSGDSGSSGASGGSGKGKGKGGSSGTAGSSGKGSASGSGKGSKSGKSSSSGTGRISSKTSKLSKGDSSASDPSASVSDSNSRYYPKSSKSSS